MKKTITLFSALLFLIATSCNNDDDPSDQKNGDDFLTGSQWVGAMSVNNARWHRPCVLEFKSNSKVTLYAVHVFNILGNWVRYDSIEGNYSNVEETNTTTTLQVNFPVINETQTVQIENRNKLASNTTQSASNPNGFGLSLDKFTDETSSLNGTRWSGKVMSGPGPVAGMYEYPDLSAIYFEENQSFYLRNGKEATIQTPQSSSFYVVKANYAKHGARVYMSGFDESASMLYPYFGVLLPGGTEMLIDSYEATRLPNYLQTFPWYGSAGITPRIHKID